MKELNVGEKTKCVVTIEAVRCGTCEECFFYDEYYHCANEKNSNVWVSIAQMERM